MAAPGTYRARARQGTARLIESQKKQTPGVEVTIDLVNAGEMTWTGYLSGGAVNLTVKAMRAMGWQGEDLNDLSTIGSCDFEVVVEDEEYRGRYYPKIKYVNEIGRGEAKQAPPLDDSKKRMLAAAMRGVIRNADLENGEAKARRLAGYESGGRQERAGGRENVTSNHEQGGADEIPRFDDDIPF